MSDLLTDDDLRAKRKPAPAYANVWRITNPQIGARCTKCAHQFFAPDGDFFCCGDVFPTYDVAETEALNIIANAPENVRPHFHYVRTIRLEE